MVSCYLGAVSQMKYFRRSNITICFTIFLATRVYDPLRLLYAQRKLVEATEFVECFLYIIAKNQIGCLPFSGW